MKSNSKKREVSFFPSCRFHYCKTSRTERGEVVFGPFTRYTRLRLSSLLARKEEATEKRTNPMVENSRNTAWERMNDGIGQKEKENVR